MKLFNAIVAASIVGISSLSAIPAKASVLVDLYRGTVTNINDGNPYWYTVQGCRTSKSYKPRQEFAYPLNGEGPGAQRTNNLTRAQHQEIASWFHEDERDGYTYANKTC